MVSIILILAYDLFDEFFQALECHVFKQTWINDWHWLQFNY